MARTPAQIIALWPSKEAVRDDARAANPDLKTVAVDRWARRGRIPGPYFSALAKGAERRGIDVTLDEIVLSSSPSEAAE